MARRGPSDHPGDKWLRTRDRQDATRGEMNRQNQEIYDQNIEAAKKTYRRYKKEDRKGKGNRGGRTAGREGTPDYNYTAADRRRMEDEANQRHVEAVDARMRAQEAAREAARETAEMNRRLAEEARARAEEDSRKRYGR